MQIILPALSAALTGKLTIYQMDDENVTLTRGASTDPVTHEGTMEEEDLENPAAVTIWSVLTLIPTQTPRGWVTIPGANGTNYSHSV